MHAVIPREQSDGIERSTVVSVLSYKFVGGEPLSTTVLLLTAVEAKGTCKFIVGEPEPAGSVLREDSQGGTSALGMTTIITCGACNRFLTNDSHLISGNSYEFAANIRVINNGITCECGAPLGTKHGNKLILNHDAIKPILFPLKGQQPSRFDEAQKVTDKIEELLRLNEALAEPTNAAILKLDSRLRYIEQALTTISQTLHKAASKRKHN